MLMDLVEKVDLSLEEILHRNRRDGKDTLPRGSGARQPKLAKQSSSRQNSRVSKPAPLKKITIRNDKAIKVVNVDGRKISASKRDLVISLFNEKASRRTDEKRSAMKPSSKSSDGRPERIEIRIRNDRTGESAVPAPEKYQMDISPQQTPMATPSLASAPQIPNLGLATTSSQFRTPMAVMDLYTGRYARPSLEPYRPPPLVQQFYRSLAESTALGHIPQQYNQPTYTHIPQQPVQIPQSYPMEQPQETRIRKPYEV